MALTGLINFKHLELLLIVRLKVPVIANNYVTNNDAGIGVFGSSGCCIVDYNKLKDNRFFGVIIGDSEHIVSNSKIFGGQIGAAAIATFDNTTAILDHVKIVGAEIPIQSL